jgi:hypothetical protein
VKSTLRTWASLLKSRVRESTCRWSPRLTAHRPETYDEVAATKTVIERTQTRVALKPKRVVAGTAYGTGKFLGCLIGTGIKPLWDMGQREEGTFSRGDFIDEERNVYVCHKSIQAAVLSEDILT